MRKIEKYILLIAFVLNHTIHSSAQDLLDQLEATPSREITKATFKSTRLVNFHTIESLGPRTLDFRISHHFGNLEAGPKNFWGLDNAASIRIALEYSYDGRLMIGVGRTSLGKLADGFLKYRLLRQREDGSMPISISLFSSTYYTMEDAPSDIISKYQDRANRLSYCSQIMIARKFSPSLSFQISPTFIHFNQVDKLGQKNNVFAIAALGRYKFTKRSALTCEYAHNFHLFPSHDGVTYYHPFALGYELETGGHVFQMFLTNAAGIAEPQTISRTVTSLHKWGIGFGFNVSRVFTL